MNTRNPRDIHGDGHGFVDVPVGRPLRQPVIVNKPGTYVVAIFDFEGLRLQAHQCDGTYDSRRLALNAVIDACSDPTVGHVEFCNHELQPREYSYNYRLEEAPKDDTRILGLYKLRAPGTEQGWVYHSRMIWLAKEPNSDLRYITDERSDAPYYIQDPIAWARTPKP